MTAIWHFNFTNWLVMPEYKLA